MNISKGSAKQFIKFREGKIIEAEKKICHKIDMVKKIWIFVRRTFDSPSLILGYSVSSTCRPLESVSLAHGDLLKVCL